MKKCISKPDGYINVNTKIVFWSLWGFSLPFFIQTYFGDSKMQFIYIICYLKVRRVRRIWDGFAQYSCFLRYHGKCGAV